MQLQFDKWKNSCDINKQKYWKSFKRWEMDAQLHTDAQGNPVDPALYNREILSISDEKAMQAKNKNACIVNWLPSGPFQLPVNQTQYMEAGMGRINCIAFHPNNPNTYFVGVAQGGIWKTTNHGQSWTPLTDNLPILRISDIAIDPNNVNTIYASICDFEYIDVSLKLNGKKRNTHYGLGVYKTTDGGISWQPTGLTFQVTNGDASLIRKILVDPTNSNKLVACGVSGMYTSNDAGQSWNKTLDSLFWDLTMDPVNHNVLYAASGWLLNSAIGNAAIYKSTNFGQTWTLLNTGIPATGQVQRIKLAIAPSDPNYIYALAVDINRGCYGIYKSTDGGVNWQFFPPLLNILEGGSGNSQGGQGTYDLALAVSPSDKEKIYTGGINIWGSTDGGQNFNPVSHWTTFYGPSIHADIHSIDFQPNTSILFTCTDGGLYSTLNPVMHNWNDANNGIPWPTVWNKLNDGLQITSFYRLSSSKNPACKLLAGAQDNSSFFFDGSNWSNIFGGDGMDNYINPMNDSSIIGSSQFGSFYQSDNNGLNSVSINPNVNGEAAEWTTPIVADFQNPGTLYAGFSNVVKSSDGGVTWTSISNFLSGGIYNTEISAMAVSSFDPNVLYAAKRVRYEYQIPGSVFTSNDGGNSWSDVTAGLPDSLYYTSIDINDTNASIAYISLAGFSAGNKVYKTTDGGATWVNLSSNLPNFPVNCLKSLPGGRELLAATDVGVYLLNESSNIWQIMNSGLPNVIVSDIELNPALNKIYVSTFGRGIWETDLDALLSIKKDATTQFSFQLFPSINDGNFQVNLTEQNWSHLPAKIEIIDIMGRKIFADILNSNIKNYALNLNPGKYFLRMTGKKSSGVKSFLVY